MKEQNKIKEYTVRKVIYTIPEQTNEDRVCVFVKNVNDRLYKYNIYKQKSSYEKHEVYMARHGCSVCALTTLLNAIVPGLENYTPDRVVSEIQKRTFGERVYKRNFRRIMALQMPVSMYGITKILERYKVEYKFVYNFKKEEAVREIREHLEKGNPVLLTLRNKKGNHKWAGTVHTMLLIGIDKDGYAIVCDSANRLWSGNNQRIKYGQIEELVEFMWSSRGMSTNVYYSGRRGTSGYILINEQGKSFDK